MKVEEGTGILIGLYQNKKCHIIARHTGYDTFEGKYYNNYLILCVEESKVIEREVPTNKVKILYREYFINDILGESE